MPHADQPGSDEGTLRDAVPGHRAARALTVTSGEPEDQPEDEAEDTRSTGPGERTWRQELPRWLATLDSGRTRHEYEKAVGYFFGAPGVPQELGAITLDLLLAYRGSLALRADHRSPHVQPAHTTLTGHPQLQPQAAPEALEAPDGDWAASEEPQPARGAALASPLAPATVNVRLTALRQFLAHCSLWDRVPQLPAERVRAALRRLKVERRRPYQVLDEREWEGFLRAAAGVPGGSDAKKATVPDPDEPAVDVLPGHTAGAGHGGPWGTTRAERARRAGTAAPPSAPDAAALAPGPTPTEPAAVAGQPPGPRRSRAGLTGRRTAQRDHALLALALASGLRAIELCSLDVDNLTREWRHGHAEWWLVLRDAQTKGQRGGRTLPLAEPLVRTLQDYIASTGRSWDQADDRATPLFLSLHARSAPQSREDGAAMPRLRRLTPEQVRRIVDRVETQWLADRGGLSAGQAGESAARAISPHALRHSTAIALLEGNQRAGRPPASVEHVRGWLGHFDIRTTQGYLAHLDARHHRRPFALAPVVSTEPASDGGTQDDESLFGG